LNSDFFLFSFIYLLCTLDCVFSDSIKRRDQTWHDDQFCNMICSTIFRAAIYVSKKVLVPFSLLIKVIKPLNFFSAITNLKHIECRRHYLLISHVLHFKVSILYNRPHRLNKICNYVKISFYQLMRRIKKIMALK
jgi:hypothetical protein